MKAHPLFAVAAAALTIGFLSARWCAAQPSNQPPAPAPVSYDFGALQKFESFVFYLQDTKQTNILQRFNDYTTASMTSRHYAQIGVTLAILQRLRDGRTNEAYALLEGSLDADLIGLAASYRDLPATLRNQTSLTVLRNAKEYRAKFPFKHQAENVDEGVNAAFKILDEQTIK